MQATASTGLALYGAYGSNLNLDQMLGRRCPDATPLMRYTLHGWRLVFRGVADIVRDPEGSVPIGVFEITRKCEAALDRYEGYPHSYTKARVKLDFGNGRDVFVMLYTMVATDYLSAPSQTYFDCIMQGYNDFGMTDQEKDALAQAALDAQAAEDRFLADGNELFRTSRGRYVKADRTSAFTAPGGRKLGLYTDADLSRWCATAKGNEGGVDDAGGFRGEGCTG